MDTGADCRRHAAEFLVYAEREPEREAHFISMAEILASPRESSRADTSPHGPREAHYSPKSKLGLS